MWSCTKISVKSGSKRLLKVSSIYLDINHYAEVQGIVRKAFEHQQVILAFSHTLHDRHFLAQANIFDQGKEADMVARIRKSTNLWITTEKPSHNKLPNQVALSQLFSKLACKKG